MTKLLAILLIFIGILFLNSCINPFVVGINSSTSLLVVEGGVFEIDTCYIKLRLSGTSLSEPTNYQITDAQVSILENGQAIPFKHLNGTDVYSPTNPAFRGKVGNTYQLQIHLSDGRIFTSAVEKLLASPPIVSMNDEFVPRSSSSSTTPSAFNIYLTLPNKTSDNHYYSFSCINYKYATYCATCANTQGYHLMNENDCNSPFKDCFDMQSGFYYYPANGSYGFPCLKTNSCWNYLKIVPPKIFNDSLIHIGGEVNVLVSQAPLSSYSKYFLEVHQNSLSKGAYHYYTQLQQLGQKTGSLFDSMPFLIASNVLNSNKPTEQAVGYFVVAGQQIKGYVVDRSRVSQVVEPANDQLEYPDVVPYLTLVSEGTVICPRAKPASRCVINGIRTDMRPKDWVD